MDRLPPRLFFYSRDPGGTNQLIALRAALLGGIELPAGLDALAEIAAGRPDHFLIHARGVAVGQWPAAGIPATRLDDLVDPIAAPETREAELARLLVRCEPRIILSATNDIDDDTAVRLWRVGQRLGIPVWVALDHPANLAARFLDRQGGPVWPDRYLAPSAAIAAGLAELKIPAAKIIQIPDLHLRLLAQQSGAGGRAELRRAWGADPEDVVILFASECGAEMRALGRVPPYDEVAALTRLRAALRGGLPVNAVPPERLLILVRPHPRDTAGKYDGFVSATPPRLVVSGAGPVAQALGAADLVVGLGSTLLSEARALGRPVFSLLAEGRPEGIPALPLAC